MGLNDKLVICPECIKKFKDDNSDLVYGYKGYYTVLVSPENLICSKCGNKLIRTNITKSDFSIIQRISKDREFIQAMIDLHDKDIIEYELKMSQFRTQLNQQKSVEKNQNDNVPKCPTCGSTDIEKISVGKKAFGGMMFGLFSSDVRNTMHCKNCGSKW